ncbi:MAG: trimeric intracellular cation channel family protein [Acutalibacteraceae bacterium]|nr:trimeric intracellular cation channel family protein [Oscillospiraceae bacterium]
MDVGGTIFYALELIGVFAFAVTGSITAIKRDLDVFGVTIMGITTALGGGVIRDILIGSLPPSMFYSYEYVLLAALTSLGIFTVAYVAKEKFSLNLELINFINNIFDAIGLGVFSVLGVSIAMGAGHSDNAFLCIFLGTLTGVGGGVLRDIMSMSTPLIFRKHIYALASILGSCTYYVMIHYGAKNMYSIIAAMLVTFVIRMLATHFKWSLPKVHIEADIHKAEKKKE